eukprot:1371993-Prymnesium_polylepis.2
MLQRVNGGEGLVHILHLGDLFKRLVHVLSLISGLTVECGVIIAFPWQALQSVHLHHVFLTTIRGSEAIVLTEDVPLLLSEHLAPLVPARFGLLPLRLSNEPTVAIRAVGKALGFKRALEDGRVDFGVDWDRILVHLVADAMEWIIIRLLALLSHDALDRLDGRLESGELLTGTVHLLHSGFDLKDRVGHDRGGGLGTQELPPFSGATIPTGATGDAVDFEHLVEVALVWIRLVILEPQPVGAHLKLLFENAAIFDRETVPPSGLVLTRGRGVALVRVEAFLLAPDPLDKRVVEHSVHQVHPFLQLRGERDLGQLQLTPVPPRIDHSPLDHVGMPTVTWHPNKLGLTVELGLGLLQTTDVKTPCLPQSFERATAVHPPLPRVTSPAGVSPTLLPVGPMPSPGGAFIDAGETSRVRVTP